MTQPTPFVVLRGGLVEHRTEPLAVLDMDILDTDSTDDIDIEDARNLRDQIARLAEDAEDPDDAHLLASLLAEANSWLHRHDSVEPYTGRPVFEN